MEVDDAKHRHHVGPVTSPQEDRQLLLLSLQVALIDERHWLGNKIVVVAALYPLEKQPFLLSP